MRPDCLPESGTLATREFVGGFLGFHLSDKAIHVRLDLLGHKSIMITMDRYGHLYPEDRSKVSDALDAAFARRAGATA